jgi:urease accessory protein
MNQENRFGRLSELRVTTALDGAGRAYARDVFFTAPFKWKQPFYTADGALRLMPMIASAGLMAGDKQRVCLDIGDGCRVEFLSQSYEKIHAMNGGQAERQVHVTVGEGASFFYRPLPALPFAGSAFAGRMDVRLAGASSRFLYADVLACGRAAYGEQFAYAEYRNILEIYRAGELLLEENTCFLPSEDDMAGFMLYEGYSHLLTLALCAAAPEEIAAARRQLEAWLVSAPVDGGVSVNGYGCLTLKALAEGAEPLLELFAQCPSLL